MKIWMFLIMFVCVGFQAFAHEGHDHGDGAFSGAKTSDMFVLSETQIKNLDLKTKEVQERIFYETVELPALIKKPSVLENTIVVQGYSGEQRDVLKLKKGQDVSLTLDAFPEDVFVGKIIRVDAEMNPKTGFFTVLAQVENLPSSLVGFKGLLTVRVSEKEKSVAVPLNALQGVFGDFFVFVKEGEHFTKVPVVVGHKSEEWIEVEGVHIGQTIVTQGSYQLQYVTGISEEEHNHTHEGDEKRDEHVHEHIHEEGHHVHDENCRGEHHDHKHEAHVNENHIHDENCQDEHHHVHEKKEHDEKGGFEHLHADMHRHEANKHEHGEH